MDEFELVEDAVRTKGAEAALELLIERARAAKNYREVFNARQMQIRQRMGLPLIDFEPTAGMEESQRTAYENALREAARETGALFLADGDIASAWPYFRAIGEPGPVAAAIEGASGGDHVDALIDIAFREQVHPRKGYELILQHRGICNAITWFSAIPEGPARRECLRLLVRNLYEELGASVRGHIERTEGTAPQSRRLAELIVGREWLFEGNNYHVDTTHLTSVLRFSPEMEDEETMRLAVEMAEYGTRLAPMYHFQGDPPFEDAYADCGTYLRALLREDVDRGVAHFRRKAEQSAQAGYSMPAEIFIDLLTRVDRMEEAIAASLEFFAESAPVNAPSAMQLCQAAGRFGRLREIARARGDVLAYAAGVIGEQGRAEK